MFNILSLFKASSGNPMTTKKAAWNMLLGPDRVICQVEFWIGTELYPAPGSNQSCQHQAFYSSPLPKHRGAPCDQHMQSPLDLGLD